MAVRSLSLEEHVRDPEERITIERVLNVILRRVGPENPIRASAIAEQVGLAGQYPERRIQAIVEFLVKERHVAIGTLPFPPYGYFIIDSLDARRLVRGHLVRRALSILRHAESYDADSILGPLIGQLELQFPESGGRGR